MWLVTVLGKNREVNIVSMFMIEDYDNVEIFKKIKTFFFVSFKKWLTL